MKVTFHREFWKPHRYSNDYTLLGWHWFSNGGWSCRYNDGTRFCYAYVGVIVFNRSLVVCMDFRNGG